MDFVLINILNGVSYGLLLFMLSAGLTLIFSMMGVLNFAHASFYMLGAYVGYSISVRFGFWPALLLSPLMVGLLGAIVERHALRYVHRHGHLAEMLFTFGVSFVILELVQLIWGRSSVPYSVPSDLDGPLFSLYGTSFPAYRGFMMGVAVLMMAVTYLFLKRTRIGLVIQAALTHPQMVEALGHNLPRLMTLVFGAGCGLAGLAGVIGGNAFVTEPGMAATVGSIIFVVVVVGGLGSLTGALIASLLIGLLQTFAVAINFSLADLALALGIDVAQSIDRYAALNLTVAQIAPLLPYLLMIAVLIARPRGLRGAREG